MAVIRDSSIEQYLQEGLLAICPVYDNGNKSAVLTKVIQHFDKRSIAWLIKQLTTYYRLDLVTLRRCCGELLNLKHHISLSFSDDLVLLPIKARQASEPGETTIGYISMMEVKKFLPAGPETSAPWLSKVIFKCGSELNTCNTVEKLDQRMKQGHIVREDCLDIHRHNKPRFAGLKREQMIETLPDCDCLLRELFMERLGI